MRSSNQGSKPSVFKFPLEPHCVLLENIADSVSRVEIVELFSNLIGDVKKCEELVKNGGGRVLELAFHSKDACKKALCMSGYTVAGVPLTVTSLTSPSSGRQPTHGRQPDIRRNLYVLGLPFDLPKSEFTSLFSRYGTVAHSVILATVDNASRRRGFVVMSSNIEARSAMTGLTRTEIKGHTIDVSWAVVQRSQGFLDGGDRAMVLASRSSSQDSSSDCSDCDSYFLPSRPSSASTTSTQGRQVIFPAKPTQVVPAYHALPPAVPISSTALSGSFSSTIILIKNLPSLLFSQTVDLHPLVCPFGELKKLGIMEPNLTEPRDGRNTLSALVEFVSSVSAQEAVKSLRGQMYAGFEVMADFADMEPTPGSPPWSSSQELPHPQTVEPAPYPTRYGVENQGGKLSLNPHAPPFVLQFPSNEAKFFSSAISHTPNAFLGARTTYPRGPLGPSLYHNLPRPQTAIPPTFFKPKSAALSHYGSDVRFSPMHSFDQPSANLGLLARPPPATKWPYSLPNMNTAPPSGPDFCAGDMNVRK